MLTRRFYNEPIINPNSVEKLSNENTTISGLVVVPNPSSVNIKIEIRNQKTQEEYDYIIVNSIGATIKIGKLINSETEIVVRNLSIGFYFI